MSRRLTGITLNARRSEPLYQQVFDQIVERVRSGTFPADYRLPPSRTLAEELGAHRNTVVRAYADLESAGFVVSSIGRGTFVAKVKPTATQAAPAERTALPWASLIAPQALAEPLGRFDRLARSTQHHDQILLGHMQPSLDLLPVELFQRCLQHTLKTVGSRALGYGPREGLPRLRALIADDLGRQGVPASADDVVITNGSQQSLDLVARALVRPGDGFAVDSLTYPGMTTVLIGAGARLLAIPGDDEGPSLIAMDRLASRAKGYYAMPRGHNPLGVTMSPSRCEALLDWSHQRGVPIIEDDFTADLALDDEPLPPALRSMDREVIYVGSFSKKLIPALRIGFVVCPPALKPVLVSLKHSLDLGNSVLPQYALAEFLDRGYLQAHLARIVPEYRARRAALEEGLAAHLPKDIGWQRSSGALHLWLPLPSGYNPEQVADEAHRSGVVVSPSTQYAIAPRESAGLRLTFCSESPDRLREGARRLGRALAALAPKAPDLRQTENWHGVV